ncbi:MAG: hypothetical protein JWQ50_1550 [Caballeronia mineralivorans]|jgi:hypothetical protein|nr:hypothetical protein [Caballeronia mineralivorans]
MLRVTKRDANPAVGATNVASDCEAQSRSSANFTTPIARTSNQRYGPSNFICFGQTISMRLRGRAVGPTVAAGVVGHS